MNVSIDSEIYICGDKIEEQAAENGAHRRRWPDKSEATRLPRIFQIVTIVAAFVAGPVIRKTKAAPGVSPFRIIAAATGTEAVAQT